MEWAALRSEKEELYIPLTLDVSLKCFPYLNKPAAETCKFAIVGMVF